MDLAGLDAAAVQLGPAGRYAGWDSGVSPFFSFKSVLLKPEMFTRRRQLLYVHGKINQVYNDVLNQHDVVNTTGRP